jgi:hypothetical protein
MIYGLDPGSAGAVALVHTRAVALVIAWRPLDRKAGRVWQVAGQREGGGRLEIEVVDHNAVLDEITAACAPDWHPLDARGRPMPVADLVVEGLRPHRKSGAESLLHLGQYEGAQRRTLQALPCRLLGQPCSDEWRKRVLGVDERRAGSAGCEAAALMLWRSTLGGVRPEVLPEWARGHAAEAVCLAEWGRIEVEQRARRTA